jgi:hypothetical protein
MELNKGTPGPSQLINVLPAEEAPVIPLEILQ